jgi:hypothetical protein
MKSALLCIALTILLIGVSPGVLLAAPPTGTAPLTSVAHDATLTGNGTSASPLRVAPSTAPAALKVVDVNNKLVGLMIDQNTVIRFDAGKALAVPVNASGFLDQEAFLMFESTDCSGTGYSGVFVDGLFNLFLGNVGNIRYFAPTTGTTRTINSQGSGPSSCTTVATFSALGDVPVTVDFSLFGLVPPFHMSQ